EEKRRGVSRVIAGEEVSAVAADLGIDRRRLYEWCETARLHGLEGLHGPGRPRKEEASRRAPSARLMVDEGTAARQRLAELERKIGEQQVDLDFFRQALRHVKARQQAVVAPGVRRF